MLSISRQAAAVKWLKGLFFGGKKEQAHLAKMGRMKYKN